MLYGPLPMHHSAGKLAPYVWEEREFMEVAKANVEGLAMFVTNWFLVSQSS